MTDGLAVCLRDLGDQGAERERSVYTVAQREQTHVRAHAVLVFRTLAVRQHGANGDVSLARVAVEQRLHKRRQNRELATARLSGESLKLSRPGRREVTADGRAVEASDSGARPELCQRRGAV